MTTIPERLVGKWKKYPKALSILVSRRSVDLYASKKAHPKIIKDLESLSPASEAEFTAWRKAYFAVATSGGSATSTTQRPKGGRIRNFLRPFRLR